MWGTVCSDEHWDDIDASVVCKQLGYSDTGKSIFVVDFAVDFMHPHTGSISLSRVFVEGEKESVLHGLRCSGSELSIFDCPRSGSETCASHQDAAVICHGN